MKSFLKNTKILTSLGGLSQGLFFTLIIGTIISQIGLLIGSDFGMFIDTAIANNLKKALGVGIGLGIGISLKKKNMKLFSLVVIGFIASTFKINFYNPNFYIPIYGKDLGPIGLNLDPLNIYIVVLLGSYIYDKIVRKKTFLDILILPLLSVLISVILTYIFSGITGFILKNISDFIVISTKAAPYIMIFVVSITMGILLTSPISSAAISIIIVLGSSPIAAAAAVLGTTIQMVGIAIQARKDNSIGVFISTMFGTSMLQFTNLIKKPINWLPTIFTTILLVPNVLFLNISKTPTKEAISAWSVGAGMGSSGLVGQVQSVFAMGYNNMYTWIFIIGIQFIGTISFVYFFDSLLRILGYVKKGDLKVELL